MKVTGLLYFHKLSFCGVSCFRTDYTDYSPIPFLLSYTGYSLWRLIRRRGHTALKARILVSVSASRVGLGLVDERPDNERSEVDGWVW